MKASGLRKLWGNGLIALRQPMIIAGEAKEATVMAFKLIRIALAAGPVLAGCVSAPVNPAPQQSVRQAPATPGVYAGKSVLDAAIEAAGGQAALGRVKELAWTGSATISKGGEPSKMEMETVVRPFREWGRWSTWVKAAGPKTARTIQAEQGKAWAVNRVTWSPTSEAQAAQENQLVALYSLMLLTPLKTSGAKVVEKPEGKDGSRTINAQLANGRGGDLVFDAAGKLVGASILSPAAAGGAEVRQTVTFSGEIVSNGVKWPRRILIEEDGKAVMDLELATFEAMAELQPRPMPHTLDDGQKPPEPRAADAG